MTVALATIRTDVYTTIYNHLQTGTYAITSNNIYPSYNDLQLAQNGYPQIIISPITISEDTISMGDNSLYNAKVNVMISIWHNSAANVRVVADEVHNKLRTGRSVLNFVGLKDITYDNDDFESIPYGQKKTTYIYRISFSARYIGNT